MQFFMSGMVSVSVLALAAPVSAQEFDCSSVRMIVPYTAGGSGDVGARLLAPYMSEELGVPVQVENIPGAGSQIGITELVRSEPDGCTVGWTHLPAAINLYLDPSRQAPFDGDDLQPIAMYVIDPGGLAVKGDSPYDSLDDIIEAARQDPGAISISDSGVLSDGHVLLLELQEVADVDFAIVHSAGGAEGTTDLLGGHVTAQTINLSGANVAMAESGQIKLLAVFTEEQVETYPGVPTATEQGYPIVSSTSRAISVPAETPVEIVQRLSDAVEAAVSDPEFLEEAERIGLPLAFMDYEGADQYWQQMEETFRPIVEAYLESQ